MAYATVADIRARTTDTIPASEEGVIMAQLDDAAVIIDAFNNDADAEAKRVVSCRMVLRLLNSAGDIPMGATQGSMSGELYLSKLDKQTLGGGNRIGSYSPVQELTGGTEE